MSLPPMIPKYTLEQLDALRWFLLSITRNADVIEEHRVLEKTDDEFLLGLTLGIQTALVTMNDAEGVFYDPSKLHNLLASFHDKLL